MGISNPLWLAALIPWAALVLWLLWGRRRRMRVPFLELWRGPALIKPDKGGPRPPPVFLAAAMLAILLAILAAAGISVRGNDASLNSPLCVILDRGMTMSAFEEGKPRFVATAEKAQQFLESCRWRGPTDLIAVPDFSSAVGRAKSDAPWRSGTITSAEGDTVRIALRNLATFAATLPPTAIDASALLPSIVREKLQATRGPVLVVTDQPIGFDEPRLIRVSPVKTFEQVGIVSISARESPAPEVMVRVRNDSDDRVAALHIISGTSDVAKRIELPLRGGERNYFVDLPAFASAIQATLEAPSQQPATRSAWLVRQASFPRIEARTALSPEMRRMIDVFARSRPPTYGSKTIVIVKDEEAAGDAEPAVILPPATGPIIHGSASATADPITANVNWSALPANIQIAGEVPKGFRSLVRVAGRTLIASTEQPVPKIWVGFEAPGWSATPDYVVFWANVLTWAGGGVERFGGEPLEQWNADWKLVQSTGVSPAPAAGEWPGVYQRADGALQAFNAAASAPPSPDSLATTSDNTRRLAGLLRRRRDGADLAPWLLGSALACLIASMAFWFPRVRA